MEAIPTSTKVKANKQIWGIFEEVGLFHSVTEVMTSKQSVQMSPGVECQPGKEEVILSGHMEQRYKQRHFYCQDR